MRKFLVPQFVLTTVILVAVIALFELTDFDIMIQNHFYDFVTEQWFIDRKNPILEIIFYSGIKKLLAAVGAITLLILIVIGKNPLIKQYRQRLIILLLTGILTPSIVGTLKAVTNTPCPRQIVQYAGIYPNIKVFESYPDDFKQTSRARCWPAGHASGGFAMMALFFVFKSRTGRIAGLLTGVILGWSMGSYKMLIGDHFFSHTLITMLIAWLIALCAAKLVYYTQEI